MSERARSRAIGLFVVSALALLVIGLLTFGSREFYTPKSRFVVIFTDSVRGLTAGATVAYQGVAIGEVREIAIQRDDDGGPLLIPVTIELRSQVVRSLAGKDDAEQRFTEGFRAKLAQQSFVTGRLMIELEYAPTQPGRSHVLASKLPQIFFVNWFRRDEDGRFMWPGYGENSRVLKWVFERLNGTAEADKTAIGYLPNATSLDTSGMQINEADLQAITSVDVDGWREAVPQIRDHYAAFGDRLPSELATALDALESSLS